jgi:glutathione S-transferase
MIKLHHLRIGRSLFTVWQLEELGLKYELEVYTRDPKTMRAPESLQKIHPLGKSPVIDDDGLVIAESSAVTTYLLEKFDTENLLAPARSDLASWAKFTQWLHYPEGSVFVPLLVKLLLARSDQSHDVFEGYSQKEIKLHFDYIAKQLGDSPYILGNDFTAADFGVTYVISLAERLGQLKPWPTLLSYLARNKARPAYLRAVERAVE